MEGGVGCWSVVATLIDLLIFYIKIWYITKYIVEIYIQVDSNKVS